MREEKTRLTSISSRHKKCLWPAIMSSTNCGVRMENPSIRAGIYPFMTYSELLLEELGLVIRSGC
jgi:hypothetical protein